MQVLKLPWHPLKAYTAQIAVLAFPTKQSETKKWKYQSEKPLIWFIELSIVAQSIESTLSEKETIEAKVRELLGNNSQRLLYWAWSRLLRSHGSKALNSKRFLTSNVKALRQENLQRNYCLD